MGIDVLRSKTMPILPIVFHKKTTDQTLIQLEVPVENGTNNYIWLFEFHDLKFYVLI
jgi:hypothetical protein